MTSEVRAALRTIAVLFLVFSIPLLIITVFSFDPELLFDFFVISIVLCNAWMIYSINVIKLDTEKKFREIRERREDA